MKNRIIKFRVWNKEFKKFLSKDEYFLDFDGNLRFYDSETLDIVYQDSYIVQQFTELLDKNGKEIYEGDILQNDWNTITQVKFGDFQVDAGDALFDGNGFFLLNIKDKEETSLSNGNNEKIIGNIFENSEPIKQLTINHNN